MEFDDDDFQFDFEGFDIQLDLPNQQTSMICEPSNAVSQHRASNEVQMDFEKRESGGIIPGPAAIETRFFDCETRSNAKEPDSDTWEMMKRKYNIRSSIASLNREALKIPQIAVIVCLCSCISDRADRRRHDGAWIGSDDIPRP